MDEILKDHGDLEAELYKRGKLFKTKNFDFQLCAKVFATSVTFNYL